LIVQFAQRPPEPLAQIEVAQLVGIFAAVQDVTPDGGD